MKNDFLKIGLDYHGVIDRNLTYFKEFASVLMHRGHQVHIITGGPCQEVTRALQKIGFGYTQIFAILDYYSGQGKVERLADGGFHIDDALWDTAKAKYCQAHKIDVHIDDSLIYGCYFQTPYCRYDEAQQNCSIDQKICLDFSLPPQEAAAELEKIFSK